MRLLVLGGTAFLSREVATEAVRRGHAVTCACRGRSGPVPDGAVHLRWDRDDEPPPELTGGHDAVVDVARQPSHVRRAIERVPDAHWVFVSTVNAYADDRTTGGSPATLPLREPITDDVDLADDPEAYGGLKVACERIVQSAAASSVVVRPGLIVGPGDPTGRFTYWPVRLADGGEVLAPGDAGDVVQVIDVRDLAAWLVTLAERRTTGVFDAVGRRTPLGALLHDCDPTARLTWVDQDFLADQEVDMWAGPGSVPLWLPRPIYAGILTHDEQPALDAGLVLRPVVDTSRDTLAWTRADPAAPVTGIDRARERDLLEAWAGRRTLGV